LSNCQKTILWHRLVHYHSILRAWSQTGLKRMKKHEVVYYLFSKLLKFTHTCTVPDPFNKLPVGLTADERNQITPCRLLF
jgi:hypothetical protein